MTTMMAGPTNPEAGSKGRGERPTRRFAGARCAAAIAFSLLTVAEPGGAAGSELERTPAAPLALSLSLWRAPVAPFLGEAPPRVGAAASVPAEEAPPGIRDNSFFIEEAYNQEPGVVQHISNAVFTWDDEDGVETRTFDYVFTQEWPLGSQKHQFSYTVPVSWFDADLDDGAGESESESGIGDILLNYRYQMMDGAEGGVAFSPRVSLVLPTGDETDGLGNGEFGLQFNLPWSFERGDFAFHANAGLTVFNDVSTELPDGETSPERNLTGFNLGTSVIYVASPVVQPMVEVFALFDEALDEFGDESDLTEVVVSPGFRWAPYTSGASQVVVGAALPIGLSDDAPDFGLFLYLSIEHPF